MTIANEMVKNFEGSALIAINNNIDSMCVSYEDNYEYESRAYFFEDGSMLCMQGSVILEVEVATHE